MSEKRDRNRGRKLNLGEIIRKMNLDKGAQEGREAKRDAQEQIIERLDSKMLQMPELEQRYLSLKRRVKSLQSTSEEINAMWEKARMERESMETDLKILEPARTPGSAVSSKKGSNIFIGLLIGIILGTAGAGVLFMQDNLGGKVGSTDQLEIKRLDTVSRPAFNMESSDTGTGGVGKPSLQDSLPDTLYVMKWAEAYNSRDSMEFYSLYDHNHVTFKEWYADSGIEGVPAKLLKKGGDDYIVRIKGVNTYNTSDSSFVTEVDLLLERERGPRRRRLLKRCCIGIKGMGYG